MAPPESRSRHRRVSTSQGKRLVTPPPTFEPIEPIVNSLNRGTHLFRIYTPQARSARAFTFRNFGPLYRFDHHRTGTDKTPQINRGRKVLYASFSLLCSLGEYFGDIGLIDPQHCRVARFKLKRVLRLLDLRKRAAIKAGTIPAISAIGEYATTQTWSRWWYEHPQLLHIEGILYTSAHTGEDAVALWERAEPKLQQASVDECALDDPIVADELAIAAQELQLPIV